MKLKEILSISGQSGLFKFISQGRNGIIVESFSDKKRLFVNASSKVSMLEDIAIYTDTEEKPLAQVFKNIFEKENGGEAISPKSSNEELIKYMEQVLPEYDKERVYVSDIKKLVNWYNILKEHNLLNFEEEPEVAETETKTEETSEVKEPSENKEKSEKPKPKSPSKKSKPAGEKKK
jgi:hypothetical protein